MGPQKSIRQSGAGKQRSPKASARPSARHRAAVLGILMLLGSLLSACGTATPYGPALDGKGYSEQKTEQDRFRVSFSGNSLTPRETVENYLLYRAAELTIENGHDHFRVVERDLESSTTYHDTITTTPGAYGYSSRRYLRDRRGFPYTRYPYRQLSSVTSHPITSYVAIANIIIYSEASPTRRTPQNDDHSYDARDVLKQLGPTIVRADPASE